MFNRSFSPLKKGWGCALSKNGVPQTQINLLVIIIFLPVEGALCKFTLTQRFFLTIAPLCIQTTPAFWLCTSRATLATSWVELTFSFVRVACVSFRLCSQLIYVVTPSTPYAPESRRIFLQPVYLIDAPRK